MLKNNKFIVLSGLLLITLSFSGCFGLGGGEDDSGSVSDAGYTTYSNNYFDIEVPLEWETIDRDEFTSDVPSETVVVFRNNVKNETFTANVNVVLKNLQEAESTVEYAKLVNNRQSSGLVDFREISKNEVSVNIGGEQINTLLVLFEARKATNENLVRYIQTYAVKGSSAYIITGAISPQESETVSQTVEKIVRSFSVK